MNRRIDLTNDAAFSTRRLPKIVKLHRLPWEKFEFQNKVSWTEREDSCERCGAVTRLLPWTAELPTLCRRCAGLLTRQKQIWEDKPLKDGYDIVFLSEYMDRRNRS